MKSTEDQSPLSIFTLFLLISFGSVSAVFFTPALPDITSYFQITPAIAQITITIFLIGYALGQLIYGPFANRYGRKTALYIGVSIAIASCVVSLVAVYLHIYWLLIVSRFFMAIGSSVGLKMSFTLVADRYSPQASTPIIATLMMAFSITPAIGVSIGGFLTQYLSWIVCFYFLGLYGFFLLYRVYLLPETSLTTDSNALKFSSIISHYQCQFENKKLVTASSLMGSTTAFVYLFAALAPFVAMNLMHLSSSQYGAWNLLLPIGGILGAQLAKKLSFYLTNKQAVFVGNGVLLVGISTIFIAFILGYLNAIWLFFPMSVINIGITFVYTNSSTVALAGATDKASASAVMSFINMGIATVGVLAINFIPLQHYSLFLPLVFLFVLTCTVILSLTLFLKILPFRKI